MPVLPQNFNLDTRAGQAAIASFGAITDDASPVVLSGSSLAHGTMTHLLDCEFMAAEAGVIPWITLPDGSQGIVNVGGARDIIGDTSKWSKPPQGDPSGVQTLYLAGQGAARQANSFAQQVPAMMPITLPASQVGLIQLPVLVLIGVLGVAAIVAGAWYATATEETRAQVQGSNLRQINTVDRAIQLATTQLQATGKVDPGIWSFLTTAAQTEQKAPSNPLLPWLIGGGLIAIGAAAWYARRELHLVPLRGQGA